MSRTPRAIALATAALIAIGTAPLATATTGHGSDVEYVDMPDEFVDIAEWTMALFDSAELELPPLRFVHHGDDVSKCSGRQGRHQEVDGASVIDLCTDDATPRTEFLVVHETAHAWATVGLTDERRNAFQEVRGWTAWRDHERLEWHENGSEQAAEIMVWGLMDRPVGIVRIHDHDCDDLEAGYRALTGAAPLHGFRDLCSG